MLLYKEAQTLQFSYQNGKNLSVSKCKVPRSYSHHVTYNIQIGYLCQESWLPVQSAKSLESNSAPGYTVILGSYLNHLS